MYNDLTWDFKWGYDINPDKKSMETICVQSNNNNDNNYNNNNNTTERKTSVVPLQNEYTGNTIVVMNRVYNKKYTGIWISW